MEVREPSAKYLATLTSGAPPLDWKVLALGAIATIERGKFTARPRNDPRLYGGDVPFLQTGDVAHSQGRIRAFSQTLNEQGLKVSRLFPEGTLFFTIAANIGDVGICSFAAACPDSLVAISPNREVSTEWLLHELASRKGDFESLASPGAQLNINLEKLRPYLLKVPPASEQREIANALTDADALIDSLEQLLTKKRQIKQGAMQELLTGKRRLPGFQGQWRVGTLKEAAEIATGINKPVSFMGRGALYVTVQDLYHGTSIRQELLGRIELSPAEIQDNTLEVGDIVFGKSSVKREGIAYPSLFLGCAEPVTFSGFTYRARARLGIADARFLFYWLRSAGTRQWLIDNSQSSALTNINKSISDSIPTKLPELQEQIAVGKVLSDMDTDITALESRLSKARALKQAMAQALLTGRIRLVSEDAA